MYHHRVGPLPLPQPTRPVAERCERSWVLTAGSRQLSFSRIEYRTASPYCPPASTLRPSWRPTTIMGAALAVMGGATLLGVAITSSRASAGYHYVVSVPVPPMRAALRPTPAPAAAVPVERRSVAKRPASPPATTLPEPAGYTIGSEQPADDMALATNASAAIQAALMTGRLQQWASPDGGERGFVVVGPAESGRAGCRSLSVLTRRDGVNAVERRRACGDARESGAAQGGVKEEAGAQDGSDSPDPS